jgi:DNA-binding NtrC family response regulator
MEAGGRPARRSGVALLDRDVVGVERLAAELEGAGIEVRIANQPEELALLLRTAEAGAIAAVVCDVMSFRPEQNVAGLIRSWDKDRPGLAFYLSYDNQSPAEAERARRIPMSLTAGHLPRPLVAARVAEAVENLVRRQGKG